MRTLLTFIIIIVILAGGAVFLAPMFISADLVKREVEAAVENATGRKLTIAGDVSISAWPALAANIGDVTFANAPGAAEPNMATMKQLRAKLAIMPLFSGTVQVDEFVLSEPVINLEVARNGKPNWQFEPAASPAGETPAPQDTGGPSDTGEAAGQGITPTEVSLAAMTIENGQISYRDTQSGAAYTFSDVDVTLALPSLDQQMTVDGVLTWNGERVNVDAAVERPRAVLDAGTTSATIAVSSNPLTLDYSGDVTFGSALATTGTVDLEVPSVRQLAAWTGSPMAEGGGFGPLSLTGQLASAGSRYTFSNATMALDGMNANGNLVVETSGARPKLSGTLAVDQIDTNVYSGEGDAGWSTEQIDFTGLKAVDANLDLSADEIIFGNIVIGASALDLELTNGRLEAALGRMSLYGGSGSGKLTLNGRQATPSLAANFNLSGLAVQPFLQAAAGFERLAGTGLFNIAVTTQGTSQAQMVNALNGTGNIDFRNGAIKGINLAQIIRTALTNPISGWSNASSADTDFSELNGSFIITNGVLANNDLKMLGPLLRLTGTGSTNIAAQTINYRLSPKLVASLEGQGGEADKSGLNIPVLVTGTWSNPKFAPDLAAVISNPTEVLKGVESLEKLQPKDIIRGLLGQQEPANDNAAPADEAAQEAAPEQKQPNPEELLRGLFGR
ncbi:AsmA family protein [Pyruvatibacter sp.]|uniref:AsmA family protein n=1 Tax=Pyruvatibacter sp. TaxID=1981328 RepID=UPI0032EC84FD